MVGVRSILARRLQLLTTHNQLTLLALLLLSFFLTLLTITSAQPQPQQQPPRPSPSLTKPSATPKSPAQCNIELGRSWCPPTQSCFIASTTFQCHPTLTTSGWTITSHLNIAFLNPATSQLLLSNATCVPLPVPLSNLTHKDILILALKRHDAYYRTSTVLISDDPAAILRGVSTCKNSTERGMEGRCGPVLGYGDTCRGNDECYNPPRSFNSTTPYNVNMHDEPENASNPTGDEPFGLVCDYEPGKLDDPPKCIHYNSVQPWPDADQNMRPPVVEQQKKRLNWIFAILVLVVIIAFVLLFMCWRKTHGRSNNGEGGSPQCQPYNVEDPEIAGGGGTEKRSEYLSTNYLSGLSTPKSGVPGAGPGQGMGGRRGGTSSQNSARSTMSYGVGSNGRRLSVAEKMVLDRDWAQDHEFMNRVSHSQRSGMFHRIEQLATSQGSDGAGVGPLSMGPSRRSMSFDPIQVYPATAPAPGGRGRGEHAQVLHLQQEPSPPPNTPENQLPATMPSLG